MALSSLNLNRSKILRPACLNQALTGSFNSKTGPEKSWFFKISHRIKKQQQPHIPWMFCFFQQSLNRNMYTFVFKPSPSFFLHPFAVVKEGRENKREKSKTQKTPNTFTKI